MKIRKNRIRTAEQQQKHLHVVRTLREPLPTQRVDRQESLESWFSLLLDGRSSIQSRFVARPRKRRRFPASLSWPAAFQGDRKPLDRLIVRRGKRTTIDSRSTVGCTKATQWRRRIGIERSLSCWSNRSGRLETVQWLNDRQPNDP